ncbi:MAG: DNA-processing protein DprA [Bacteroidota bacterium]
MGVETLIALLRRQKAPCVGAITAKKLIAHCGSPEAVFMDRLGHLKKIEGIGTARLQGLFDLEYLEAAQQELEYIKDNGIGYSYFMEESYPSWLKHCVDGPLLLFQRGNINLRGKRILSVVGTRNMTGYGADFCTRFIHEIAPLDPVIVSGFAYGVDICVQRAAMDAGLQTIGCLAHGLNQIYPKAHVKYTHRVEGNGGFLTEFWSTSMPERENFLKRNRIIAGMSAATVVVESAEKGGSLVTADIAHGYNRDVFAVPGRAGDKFSSGCNTLIKQQKARILTSAADLVYWLGWEVGEEAPKSIQKALFVELDETEQSIYTYLQREGKQLLDTIAMACQIPIYKVSSTLLNMEMKGVVRPLPGKLFEAI